MTTIPDVGDDPHKQLWATVLLQAIDDIKIRGYRPNEKNNAKEALWWVTGSDTGFDNVCLAIGLNPQKAREGVIRCTSTER